MIEKNNNKLLSIMLVILSIFVGMFYFYAIRNSSYDANDHINTRDVNLLAEESNIPGFVEYKDIEDESSLEFSVLMPSNNPEKYKVDLKEIHVKNYQDIYEINSANNEFVQYSVNISVPQGGLIFSGESIKSYLDSAPEAKASFNNGTLIDKKMTTYKGLIAIEYLFEDEINQIAITHKGISFIAGGIPVSLAVNYPSHVHESRVYYDEYIKSFSVKNN